MRVGSGVAHSLGPPSVEGHAAEVDAAEAVSSSTTTIEIISNEFFYVFFAARTALTRFLPTLAHGEYCPRCANVETSINSGAGVSAI